MLGIIDKIKDCIKETPWELDTATYVHDENLHAYNKIGEINSELISGKIEVRIDFIFKATGFQETLPPIQTTHSDGCTFRVSVARLNVETEDTQLLSSDRPVPAGVITTAYIRGEVFS